MVTPTVIKVDPMAPQVISPIRDEPYGPTSKPTSKPTETRDLRRSRRQAVEIKNFNEMRNKYQETKAQMERMKKESENNKKMLLEMSGVLSALKDISVDYERDELASKSPAVNVQRKIRAIDNQLKSAMIQCGNLEEEKELQSSTIKAQEGQIKTMEEQIALLQEQLKLAEEDQRKNIDVERKALVKMNSEGELAVTIRAQERKILALEEQLRQHSDEKTNALNQQIMALKGSNEAKYQEIVSMEMKLQALRMAQTTTLMLPPSEISKDSGALVRFNAVKNHSGDQRNISLASSSSSTGSSGLSAPHTDRRSLASISEEDESQISEAADIEDDIYADDTSSSRARSFQDPAEGSFSDYSSVHIENSDDEEGVEVSVQKGVADTSYTTEGSTRASSSVPNFEEEYNQAMLKIEQLRAENQSLRKNHSDALSNMAQVSNVTADAEKFREEHRNLKRALEEQKQYATMSDARCEKLRRGNLKLVEELNEEKARYNQLLNDYGRVAHRKEDMDAFENLKKMHSAVVMKLAEISEDCDKYIEERDAAKRELEASESKRRATLSEMDATKNAYQDLQHELTAVTSKLRKVTEQCDELKTKYYESLAADTSIEAYKGSIDSRYESLRREYESVLDKLRNLESLTPSIEQLKREKGEALAKLESMDEISKELENIREKYHGMISKAKSLEKELSVTNEKLASAEKREKQKAMHLKDMLSHYKRLETEHEEVQERLKTLELSVNTKSFQSTGSKEDSTVQLGPAGYAALADHTRIAALQAKISALKKQTKELQLQRDNAIDELNQAEEELIRTRLERSEAIDGRKSREEDLKTVLGHYRELQKVHEDTKKQMSKLEFELKQEIATQVTESTTAAMLFGQKGNSKEIEPPSAAILESVEAKTEIVTEEKGDLQEIKSEEEGKVTGLVVVEEEDETPQEDQDTPINATTEDEDDLLVQGDEAEDVDNVGIEEDANDTDSIAQLLVDMERLKQEKEERTTKQDEGPTDASTVSNVSDGVLIPVDAGGADANSELTDEAPIAKLLKDLEDAKSRVWELEAKEEATRAQMEITERKLQVALREAEDAKKNQVSREENLRNVVAQKQKIENGYRKAQADLKDLRLELEKARTEAKLREEEAKEVRKRANGYHSQCKKLQEKLQRLEQ